MLFLLSCSLYRNSILSLLLIPNLLSLIHDYMSFLCFPLSSLLVGLSSHAAWLQSGYCLARSIGKSLTAIGFDMLPLPLTHSKSRPGRGDVLSRFARQPFPPLSPLKLFFLSDALEWINFLAFLAGSLSNRQSSATFSLFLSYFTKPPLRSFFFLLSKVEGRNEKVNQVVD